MDRTKLWRIGAFIVDIVILGAIVSFSEGLLDTSIEGKSYDLFGMNFSIKLGVTFLIYVMYFLIFDVANRGNTVGKIIFRIKVVTEDNSTPRCGIRMIRTILKIVSIIILPISILLFFLNDSFTIHDRYAKTLTIRGK